MMEKNQPKSILNRKDFLNWMWGLSLVGLFGQSVAALLQFLKPRITPGAFGGGVDAGALGEFESGTVSYVQKGRFYISRLEDGGFLALWQRCTHLGCTIPWSEDLGQFNCPCHSSFFDTKGDVIGGPAPRAMDRFSISVEDGRLIIDTSQPIERYAFEPSDLFYVD
jgi:cytochrome b6-f complex iron-sulfur subunit